MATYEYEIINDKGKLVKGSIEAESDNTIYQNLRKEGNTVISVKEQSALNKEVNLGFHDKVKERDLAIFCRQFNSLLISGITIVEALGMLIDETEKKSIKNAISEIQLQVKKGETLAGAMRQQQRIFPPIMINMVDAGEASGSLETALNRLANQFDKDAKLKSLLASAMVYPIAILLVTVGVIIILMTSVIPNFKDMFSDIGAELPWTTKAVMGMSNFMISRWYIILIVVIAVIVVIICFKNSDAGCIFFGKLALKLPLFGKMNIKSSCARFARTMSTLMSAGISMLEAITITSKIISNHIIKTVLENARTDVERGVPLSETMEKSGVIPPRVYHMLKIGEETGNIESMMDSLADYYEEEVETTTKSLTTILEPLIIVVLAVVVGFIIMAVMQPMLSMYSNIEKM